MQKPLCHTVLEILRLEKITPSGVGEHFGRFYSWLSKMALVTEARFGCSGSTLDKDGNVYATDGNNNRNRKNYIIWCGNYFWSSSAQARQMGLERRILIYSVWAYVY
jgi:hypothetical protein